MKDRKNEFAVLCIPCGKKFYADTEIICGGTYNGEPLCKTNDVKRAMDKRFPKEERSE